MILMFFANDKHRSVGKHFSGNLKFMIITMNRVIHASAFWRASIFCAFVITLNARND